MGDKAKNLPVPVKKTSLIGRIRENFSRKSEISKIAEQISGETNGQIKEIYDFFKKIESNKSYKNIQRWGTKQTIQFMDLEGKEKTFDIGKDQYGIGEIKIGDSRILTYDMYVGDDLGLYSIREATVEYLNLIEYAQFLNSKTGDKTFINEFGRTIERISKEYDSKDVEESSKLGKRLDKALLKNPTYKQTKRSFDRAYKEYKKTSNEIKQSYSKTEESSKSESLAERYRVESVSPTAGIGVLKEGRTEKRGTEEERE